MEYLEDYDFTLHYHPCKANVVVDTLSRKSQGVLAIVASREWQRLETVGQFRLHYSDQAQGALGSLVATLSLLSRVIESQGQDIEISSIKDRVLAGTKVGPSTQMVVFGIGDGFGGSPADRLEK